MSREIKFRAFDSISKKLHTWDVISMIPLPQFIHLEHYTLEQFTGIIDKDDVDIYEGDKCLKDGDTTVYIVSWNQQQGQYWLMPLNDGVFDFPYQLSNGYLKLIKIKVIGNINENKD